MPVRDALAAHYDISEKCILVGSGATEIIRAAAECHRAGEMIISSPSFPLYPLLGQALQYLIIEVQLRGYEHDLKAIKARIRETTKLLILDIPHYISGTVVPVTACLRLAKEHPGILLIIDNVSFEFASGSWGSALRRVTTEARNILLVRSFSKAHGLLGLRVGYGIGAPELIERIKSTIMPFSVNALGQIAAVASLRDESNLRRNVRLNAAARRQAYRVLKSLSIPYVNTQSNAVLINVGSQASMIAKACLAGGIPCRDERKCGMQGHIQFHLIDPVTVGPFLNVLRSKIV
jgi:histidinol-phosphate aminotransferase